jgi:hypothetical protein
VLIARFAFTRVHLYWRVRVPSNCQIPRVRKVPPGEHQSASRHSPRVPKARGDQSRCFSWRNCRESHLSLVPRVKDYPRVPLKLFRRTKILTWAPILAVRWKYFDGGILNLQLFVNCGQKIFYPSSDLRSATQQTSDTEFGRMLNQNMGVLPPDQTKNQYKSV